MGDSTSIAIQWGELVLKGLTCKADEYWSRGTIGSNPHRYDLDERT